MPRIEQFHPRQIYSRFQEWRATIKARSEFKAWQASHPVEARILNILDAEFMHKAILEVPASVELYSAAQQERRELGFGDHLVPYAHEFPIRIEEFLVRDRVELNETEMKLLKEVNHGYWARVGVFTKGVRRLKRLG